MTAKFYEVTRDQGKNPEDAIKLLGGTAARGCLADYYAGFQIPPWHDLASEKAMLMSGTTDDLQKALQSDLNRGLRYILVKDLMAIWYARRLVFPTLSNLEPTRETVVSIASVQGYWGLKMNDPSSSGYRWRRMYQGHCYKGGISLGALVNQLLPMAKGVKHWKLKIGAVPAEEAFLRSWTPPGLAMSPDPDEVRLVGDLQTVFNDAARRATKDRMDEYVTGFNNPARDHHIQSGFPTVVKQFMLDVDRCEIRVGGDRTHGTLLKATGGEDPRKALSRFAGTDAGALNFSKFLNQFLTKAMVDKGARVAFANANGQQLAPGAAGVLPGNAKDQFFSVQRKADSFVIDYETEQALKSFNKGGADAFVLDGNASWLKASMQIAISVGNLEAGNLSSYSFTLPPEATIHTEVTKDSLAKQMESQVV